jgi:hypothetical protein
MEGDGIILLAALAELCEPARMNDLLGFVRRGVLAHKGRWPELARASDVSYSWVSKLGAGTFDQTNIGIKTLESVAKGLQALGYTEQAH